MNRLTRGIVLTVVCAGIAAGLYGCKEEDTTSGNLVEHGVIDDVTGKFTAEAEVDESTPLGKNDAEIRRHLETLSTKEDCEEFRNTWIDSCSTCYEIKNTMNTEQLNSRYEFNPMDESDIPAELQYCNINKKVREISNIDKYSNVKVIVENGSVQISLDGLNLFPTSYDCDAINKLVGKREQQLNS